VVTGIVGCAGLRPTVAAIEAGKDIALANKETLIAGAPYVLPLARKYGVNILPADSEHSALFQVGENAAAESLVKKSFYRESRFLLLGLTGMLCNEHTVCCLACTVICAMSRQYMPWHEQVQGMRKAWQDTKIIKAVSLKALQ
jgi:hypothetical protein